ncbi:MAG: ferredoxin--nitrite reductase, partial [Chloroflexi bacterium]|nr:ferredoxin--nitrite reductase [Chloroflexota bacterium]
IILPHIPEASLAEFMQEPALAQLRPNPSPVLRSLVVCTGDDYCHFALIDTKGLAMDLVDRLDASGAWSTPLRIHVSGCPHACGQHRMGDIGLQGAKIKVDGVIVPAADVFVGGSGNAALPVLGREVGTKVPWSELPALITGLGQELEAARGTEPPA